MQPYGSPSPSANPAGFPTPPSPPAPQAKGSDSKEGKAPSRRVLGTNRKLALVLAGLAAIFVLLTVTATDQPGAYVVRTSSDLGAFQVISEDDLVATAVPDVAYVESGAVTAPTEAEALERAEELIVGRTTPLALPSGAQVRPDTLSMADAALLASLGPDERLVSISATPANAVAGKLRVGDRVDVVVVAENAGVTSVIAQDIPIVDVQLSAEDLRALSSRQANQTSDDTTAAEVPANPVLPGVYTVRANADLASRLVAADATATVFLAYRAPGAADTPSVPVGPQELLCGTDADCLARVSEMLNVPMQGS